MGTLSGLLFYLNSAVPLRGHIGSEVEIPHSV